MIGVRGRQTTGAYIYYDMVCITTSVLHTHNLYQRRGISPHLSTGGGSDVLDAPSFPRIPPP